MKVKEIVRTHGIDGGWFTSWLPQSGYKFKQGLLDTDVDDSQNIPEIVAKFKEFAAAQTKAHEEAQALQQAATQQLSKDLAGVLVTSGFNFDGYTITKYSGYISGDDIIELDRSRMNFVNSARNTASRSTSVTCGIELAGPSDLRWID